MKGTDWELARIRYEDATMKADARAAEYGDATRRMRAARTLFLISAACFLVAFVGVLALT